MESESSFEEFTNRLHDFLLECPNACLYKGVDKDRDKLPDPSLGALEARAGRAQDLRDELDKVTDIDRDFHTHLDGDLARLLLDAEINRSDLDYMISNLQQPPPPPAPSSPPK